jgi:hypothetical protein
MKCSPPWVTHSSLSLWHYESFYTSMWKASESPGGLVTVHIAGIHCAVSDSVDLWWAWEFAFQTSSQVVLLVQTSHFEKHWPLNPLREMFGHYPSNVRLICIQFVHEGFQVDGIQTSVVQENFLQWWKCSLSVLAILVVASHIHWLNIWNEARQLRKWILHLNLNSHK